MKFRSFYRTFFFKIPVKLLLQAISKTWLASILMICLCQSARAQAPIENLGQIQTQVAQFLTDEYLKTKAAKVDIKVGNLDKRLRLAQCEQNLQFNMKDVAGNGGNINVQVACTGRTAWTILVPAVAKIYRPMAVAGRTLQRGELVGENDLTTEIKEMTDFRMGFALLPETIIGKEVKFTVNKGEAFRNSVLDAPLVIKRGDTVSMEASAGEISVRTNGTAVSDGRIGQQIRVKNNQSARVINARVVGPGQVQSIM